jgi:hypothetical protein
LCSYEQESRSRSKEWAVTSQDIDSSSVWLEASKPLRKEEKGALRAGTLNHIIIEATAEESVGSLLFHHISLSSDTKFVKMLITTYKSFASPEILLQKLMERFLFDVSMIME